MFSYIIFGMVVNKISSKLSFGNIKKVLHVKGQFI